MTNQFGLQLAATTFDAAVHPRQLDRPLYGAKFGQSLARFFRNYARFTGRASKSEFWWSFLVVAAVRIAPIFAMVPMIFVYIQSNGDSSHPAYTTLALLFGVIYSLSTLGNLGLAIPMLAVTWRRLHDANVAGSWALLLFIPVLGLGVVLIMSLMPSTPYGRRFDLQIYAPPTPLYQVVNSGPPSI